MTLMLNQSEDSVPYHSEDSVMEWIRSAIAISHLEEVIRGTKKSKRHRLFMTKKERLDPYSSLSQMANPCYLDPVSHGLDIQVLKELKKIYTRNIHQVELKIKHIIHKIFISPPSRRVLSFKGFIQRMNQKLTSIVN